MASYMKKEEAIPLVAAAIQGDAEAKGVLFTGFEEAVVGYIKGVVGLCEDIQDLKRRTFRACWENFENSNNFDSFYLYLCDCANKVALDLKERNKIKAIAVRAAQGDQAAIEELHKKFEKRLFNHIKRRLAPGLRSSPERLKQETEELAQKVWEYCLEKIDVYDPNKDNSGFWGFLKDKAKWMFLRYYDESVKLATLDAELPEETSGEPVNDGDGGETSRPYSRIPRPDQAYEEIAVRIELLNLFFSCSSKPNHKITSGFQKLLEWRPREIVTDLSKEMLQSLSEKLKKDHLALWGPLPGKPGEGLGKCFDPLLEEMKIKVNKRYREPAFKSIRDKCGNDPVGATMLRCYYGKNPEKSIADWTYKHRGRVKAALGI